MESNGVKVAVAHGLQGRQLLLGLVLLLRCILPEDSFDIFALLQDDSDLVGTVGL